jgi:hypothetical protein
MSKENIEDILETVNLLARNIERHGYKNLAGLIRSEKSRLLKKKDEPKMNDVQLLLTKVLKRTYQYFYYNPDLLVPSMNFFKVSLECKDVHLILTEKGVKYEVSLTKLIENNKEILRSLKKIIDLSIKKQWLDVKELEGWGLWEKI